MSIFIKMKQRYKIVILASLLLGIATFSSDLTCVSEDTSSDQNLNCKECQPLMWFVNKTKMTNSTIIFFPGEHNLKNNCLNFSFMDKLKLLPSEKDPTTYCRVVCSGYAGFSSSSPLTLIY